MDGINALLLLYWVDKGGLAGSHTVHFSGLRTTQPSSRLPVHCPRAVLCCLVSAPAPGTRKHTLPCQRAARYTGTDRQKHVLRYDEGILLQNDTRRRRLAPRGPTTAAM